MILKTFARYCTHIVRTYTDPSIFEVTLISLRQITKHRFPMKIIDT